jgi:hypothetical protein
VLVAFAVAALLLVAVLRIISLSLDGGDRSEAYIRATLLAESTLDTMGVAAPLRDGDTADLADGPFRLHAVVERYQEPGAPPAEQQYVVLYRVSATVTWRENGHEGTLTLATLKLGPQQQ